MVKLRRQDLTRRHVNKDLPALDVDFLTTATFRDIALRTEIIGLFRQQIKTLTGQLALPLDAKSWAYLTHTLKGSASAVGAQQLSDMADCWEKGAFPDSVQDRAAKAAELSAGLVAFNAVADTLLKG